MKLDTCSMLASSKQSKDIMQTKTQYACNCVQDGWLRLMRLRNWGTWVLLSPGQSMCIRAQYDLIDLLRRNRCPRIWQTGYVLTKLINCTSLTPVACRRPLSNQKIWCRQWHHICRKWTSERPPLFQIRVCVPNFQIGVSFLRVADIFLEL
jgi:hypothetical protein